MLELNKMRIPKIEDGAEFLGQLLVLGIVISMTRAFALTNLFEILLWCICVLNANLRSRLIESIRDTRVLLVLVFWGWIAISALWSEAPVAERFIDWWSWRKLALVPICFALFQSEKSKIAVGLAIISVCSVFAVFSWLGYFGLVELDRAPSQLLENHSTQGVLFTGSALISCLLVRQTRHRLIQFTLLTLIAIFVANVVMVVTGRSGYLFLLVCATYCGFVILRNHRPHWLVLPPLIVFCILGLSDTANMRILQAFNEASEVISSPSPDLYAPENGTSVGHRIVMWSNTATLILNKPILGSGSGGFKYDYAELVEHLSGWRGKKIDDPHQQYLHIAAEYGLVGLTIFLVTLLAWLLTTPMPGNLLHFAAIGILLGTIVNGMANGHFSAFVEGRFLWITLAVFLSGTHDWVGDRFFGRKKAVSQV